MTLLLSRTTFHFQVSGCCVQRQWSKRHSNKCSAYNTSGLKQKGAKTCLITIEAKAWCDCHWGEWYCSSCSHNFSFTRKRSNGWYCTKAQCCTNLYGVSNKRRIKRWNLRLVILCVKILTSSDAIAIPNMCLFSPQTQLFVKFFSMQKRRSREKVDFATKQHEWQQKGFCDKTAWTLTKQICLHISHVEKFLHMTDFSPHFSTWQIFLHILFTLWRHLSNWQFLRMANFSPQAQPVLPVTNIRY